MRQAGVEFRLGVGFQRGWRFCGVCVGGGGRIEGFGVSEVYPTPTAGCPCAATRFGEGAVTPLSVITGPPSLLEASLLL